MSRTFIVFDYDSNEEVSSHPTREDAEAAIVFLCAKAVEPVAFYIAEKLSN